MPQLIDPQILRKTIRSHFSLSEIKDLCLDLGIPHEEIPGDTPLDKARELVLYCQRHGRLPELAQRVVELRPKISINDFEQDVIKSVKNNKKPGTISVGEINLPGCSIRNLSILLAFIFIVFIGLSALSNDDDPPNPTTALSLITPLVATPSLTATKPTATTVMETLAIELPTKTPTLTAPPATPTVPTATPTATELVTIPASIEGVFAIGLGICDITVYAGPDTNNVHLGDLREGEEAEIIGRTTQSEWLKVITARGIEGWIDPRSVQITSGNVEDVLIVWPGLVTSPASCFSPESGAVQPPGGCVTVHIEKRVLSDDYFDEVLFSWSNVTENAQYLRLQISGTVDGKTRDLLPLPAPLVEPTEEYLVGRWRFEDGGFAHGSGFVYLVTTVDANSNNICSVSGQFTQR